MAEKDTAIRARRPKATKLALNLKLRAIPGHWEGDLIMGRGKSSIGTLVERTTHYVMLFALEKPTAENVRMEMTKKIMQLPEQLRKSITWDRDKEMAQHRQFTIDSGIQVYFCDPRSPW